MLCSEVVSVCFDNCTRRKCARKDNFLSPPHRIISLCMSLELMFNGAQHWRCSLVDLNYAVAAIRFRTLCGDIYKYKVPSFAKSCLFLFVINWNTREKNKLFFSKYITKIGRSVTSRCLACFATSSGACVSVVTPRTACGRLDLSQHQGSCYFQPHSVSDYSAEIVIRDVTDVLWLLRDYFRPFRDDTDV